MPAGRFEGPVELVLLHTADTHAMLFPFRTLVGAADARHGLGRVGELRAMGGFSRLATLLRAERSRSARVLHLDAGDLFQGSLAFERFGGVPELLAFDALRVDAQAVGNHELDHGAELVRSRYETLARFPLLAVNYAGDGTGGLASLVEPFVVLDARGLRVGVVGVGNASSVGLLRERPSELSVLSREASGAVQGALDQLRPLVDLVVVVSHLGLDADRALVRQTSGIDAVLGGHQHITLDTPEWALDCGAGAEPRVRDAWGKERVCSPRRVPIVHSGAYGKTFGRLTLSLAAEPSKLGPSHDPLDGHEVTALHFELVPVTDDTPEDPELAELLAPYRSEPLEALGAETAVAYAPGPLERVGATGGDSPLGNLLADVLRVAAEADVAVLGASSLRHDLPPGVLDLDGLVRVVPFTDPLVRAELPGTRLLGAFEQAARSASRRDCRTQVHVGGALVRFRCPCDGPRCARVFVPATEVPCASDADCEGIQGACSAHAGVAGHCFAPLDEGASYRVATTAYLAGGGSGLFDFIAESARTEVSETLSSALLEALYGGAPCPRPADASAEQCENGCARDALGRVGEACRALGLGQTCGDAANLCPRAVSICRHLPCLGAAEGARRDGRIRFEAL